MYFYRRFYPQFISCETARLISLQRHIWDIRMMWRAITDDIRVDWVFYIHLGPRYPSNRLCSNMSFVNIEWLRDKTWFYNRCYIPIRNTVDINGNRRNYSLIMMANILNEYTPCNSPSDLSYMPCMRYFRYICTTINYNIRI